MKKTELAEQHALQKELARLMKYKLVVGDEAAFKGNIFRITDIMIGTESFSFEYKAYKLSVCHKLFLIGELMEMLRNYYVDCDYTIKNVRSRNEIDNFLSDYIEGKQQKDTLLTALLRANIKILENGYVNNRML